MQNVFRVAILGSLVVLAAPVQAQQFSFMTGDRALQGYAARPNNDGYQAGGGGVPGQAPDQSNSPYQSSALGGTAPGAGAGGTASTMAVNQGGTTPGGGGAAGGQGMMLRTVGDETTGFGGGGATRMGTLDGSSQGPGSGQRFVNPGVIAGATGAGGQNAAISGTLPGGLGCPPACGTVGGRASALNTGNQAGIVRFDNAAAAGGGGGGGGTTPYQFKFQAPQTQAFANLGPVTTPAPSINPPVVNIPAAARVQPVVPVTPVTTRVVAPVAPVANINTFAGGARPITGTVGGVNSGMGANTLQNLKSVNSVNNLMLNGRQKP